MKGKVATRSLGGKKQRVTVRPEYWEKVGVVGVDTGQVWIGDPCFQYENNPKRRPETGHEGVTEWDSQDGIRQVGVTVDSGYGDGFYDVFVQRSDGRIAAVMVEFIGEDIPGL